jgi:endo-1,4-beta-xylanase
MTYISKDDPPFLVVDGTADPLVPPQQGEFFVQALKQGSVSATMEYVFGAGHSINQVLTPEMMEEVTTFFDANLRGGKRLRGDIGSLTVPADSWVDPIQGDFGGTFYKTFDTPSRGVKTQASYRLYLPPDYQSNKTRRYPVIYYLHGLNDSSRKAVYVNYLQQADAAIRSGIMPPAIIVCVQAPNHGWYVNSTDGKFPIESVVVKDLIAHVDSTYRTIATREARAIEGHSMGGYGALHLAFKYPNLFGSVTSYSAALIPTAKFASSAMNKEMLATMFGDDLANYDNSYPGTLVEKNADKIRGRMYIRGMVGDQDGLMTINQTFAAQLTSLHIPHEFYLSKGAPHSIKEVLARLDFNPFAYYATVFSDANIQPGSSH